MNRCAFRLPTPPVGYWIVGKTWVGTSAPPELNLSVTYRFAMHKRPRWLTRLMARWLLELAWEDA